MRTLKQFRISAISIVLLGLAGCVSERAPSQADLIRSIPSTSIDSGLNIFKSVCVDGARDPQNPAFLIDRDRTASNGLKICSMRARLPANMDAFFELRSRFGEARSSGILTVFNGYPFGQLLFLGGIRNGAGEGTYQIAITQ